MRRILHIIDSLGRSGTANQLRVLVQGLAKQGFDVHVAALDGRGALAAEFAVAGVPTTELNRRWSHDPIAYARLLRLVSRLRPDVIHTWNFDAGLYGRMVGRIASVPHLVAGQYRIEPLKGGWEWSVDRRLSRRTERFVTNSAVVRDWCVHHGLPAEKFTVIPPGVPCATGSASATVETTGRASGTHSGPSEVSREELLRELRLPADARLIGVVGRLVPEKRVQDLIWSADLLRVLHDNLRLLIIGDGPQWPQLEQYARLASDLDHIQFLGERADVWRIMPHLDVLWNASENRSHSIAILEAMAAGVPVIASDTPINCELIVENETGYLIPLGTRAGRAARARHTDRIFTDADLAAPLAAAARQRIAEHLRAEQMVQQHVELCSALGTA